MEKILSDLKLNTDKSIDFFKKEIATIRTSRATPALIEDVQIDYYGQKMPLKQLATILSPQPNVLVIQPWDKNAVEVVAKSQAFAKLGYNPIVDQNTLKIILPSLTQERRQELVKLVRQKAEEGKISIRAQREEALRELKKIEKTIPEDEKFRVKNQIQKIVDDSNKQVDELVVKKEKDLSL